MRTEVKPISLEDLAISEDCTRQAHRLRKLAEEIREGIMCRRREAGRAHDQRIREILLCGIVDSEERARILDSRADIWADEADRWMRGVE